MNLKMSHIIILIYLIFISITCYADPPLPTPVARVIWIKGTLLAVMPSKEERKLQRQSVIYLKDTLITDANSLAQIVFTDNSLYTFEKNTKFVVADYKFSKKNSVGHSVMDLAQGGFRTITGVIANKNHNNYSVHTPVATIGVRGTDYVVHIEGNKLYMEQYKGLPCISNEKGTLCLDKNHKYGEIGLHEAPSLLTEKPSFFKEKLTIIPATISGFGTQNGNSTGGGNSFCILQ